MPVFLANFSTLVAHDMDVQMYGAGALPLWPGCWLIVAGSIEEASERLICLRRAAGHIVLPIEPGALDALMASGVTQEGRVFFQEHFAPIMMKARPDIHRQGRVVPFGTPRGSVIAALTAAVDDPPAARAVSPLCRIMLEEGSDKSLGWHVYAPLYMDLLATVEGGVRSVFEFGLGSNNVDIPSNMGVLGVPGASLRGWRRYLPESFIGGADVDKRILFQEPGIWTYYVDQLAPKTIMAMWVEAGPQPRDFIIDDGLHVIEAAENTLANSLPQLSERGLYIIEDVLIDQLDEYVTLGVKYGLSGAAIVLASLVNPFDNALVVMHR